MKEEKTQCHNWFVSAFVDMKIESHPLIGNKHPDYKITLFNQSVYVEIFRPDESRVFKGKRKKPYRIGDKNSASVRGDDFEKTAGLVISRNAKEKRREHQLPENEPSILIIDFSNAFTDGAMVGLGINIIDYEYIFESNNNLTGIILFGLGLMPKPPRTQNVVIWNKKTKNPITEAARIFIESKPSLMNLSKLSVW